MSSTSPTNQPSSRDSAAWAMPVDKLQVTGVPVGAVNLNVDGRQVVGPLQGFGQLWQKTYRIRLDGINATPKQVIQVWKANFPKFWKPGNQFFAPLTSIQPGEVAVLNLAMPGGMMLSTGVIVVFADDESFAFMTPKGHMYAALITFSAYIEEGATFVQVQPLLRANDPLYEISMRLGFGHKMEDEFWRHTLKSIARYFGSLNDQVQQTNALVDPRMQWSEAKNIWDNAAIRTVLYAPVRMVKRLFAKAN